MIDAPSLLAPIGEIELEFFPEEDESTVTERLDAYIAEGTRKSAALSGAEQDVAVTAWAYHRAYLAIYTRLLAAPSSWSLNDEGSASRTGMQISAFRDLAVAKLSEFNGLVAAPVTAAPPPVPSGSTVHNFAW